MSHAQTAFLIALAALLAYCALYCLIEWLEEHVLGDDDPVEQMVAALMADDFRTAPTHPRTSA